MNRSVASSYRACQGVARRSASSFYYTFYLLPRDQRLGMCALYAFMRVTDDLADSDQPIAERARRLDRWRDSFERALIGQFDTPLMPAIADAVARFRIPPDLLRDVLDGVRMDLAHSGFDTFDQLRAYCEKVASAVGLACLHIWGFRDARALEPARDLGIGFQLTNILRDLKEDASRGRMYLPREDLTRFGCRPDDVLSGRRDARCLDVIRFELARAEGFFDRGQDVLHYLGDNGRAVCGAMTDIYRQLLSEIKRRDGDVFTSRVRLSAWRKLRLTAAWMLPSVGSRMPAP